MIRRLLCLAGIHRLNVTHVCFAWEPVADWLDRWYICDSCGCRLEHIEPKVKA